MPIAKQVAVNLLVSLGSLILCLMLFEGVIFRYVLLPSDIPHIRFMDGMIKYRPNQRGVFRKRDEVESKYRINDQGWNSKYQSYRSKMDPDLKRIVMIGDSYLEAFQVDFDQSLAEQLEAALGQSRLKSIASA